MSSPLSAAAKCHNCDSEIANGAPFGHCPVVSFSWALAPRQTRRNRGRSMSRSISLVLVLLAGCLGQLTLLAQTGPLYLALKGVGVSASGVIGGGGSDVQVVGNYAYVAWFHWTDTNHPGGLEIFDVTDPANPVQIGGYDSRVQLYAARVV